jgi:hypothetical protein
MVKSGFKNDVPVRSVSERRTCVTICHLLNIGRLLGRNLKWNPDAKLEKADIYTSPTRLLALAFGDHTRICPVAQTLVSVEDEHQALHVLQFDVDFLGG